MYRKCPCLSISNRKDDGTAFTRTIVSRFKFTLMPCMAHQFEAEGLTKQALPTTRIRPITVWLPFWLYQSYEVSVCQLSIWLNTNIDTSFNCSVWELSFTDDDTLNWLSSKGCQPNQGELSISCTSFSLCAIIIWNNFVY